jgi:cysteine desulfurase
MALKLPIFMDSQSTTPVDPRVLEAMIPYFTEKFGHPASRNHPFGWEAEGGVDKAREQIAKLIGARDPKEVVFTSGGTEAINLALKGVAEMYREKGNHLVTTTIEQRATLDVCKRLERQGFEITYVPVGRDGLVDVDAIRAALTDKTILISVMFANNEIGTIQPVAELGKLAKEKGILFHTDATQAVGKVEVDVEAMGIDLLSATAHMIYGPKGVGALYVRRKNPRVRLAPMVDGGGHERGMRSGTVPVPLAVGFGKAAEICREVMGEKGDPIRRVVTFRTHVPKLGYKSKLVLRA